MIMLLKFCFAWTGVAIIFMLYYVIFLNWSFREIRKLFVLTLLTGYVLLIIWHLMYGIDLFFYGPESVKMRNAFSQLIDIAD